LILPASRRVVLDQVGEIVGASEVRLAREEEMGEVFTGCAPGAIPALSQWPDVPVLMDASLQVEGKILLQAGTHEDAVRVPFDEWFGLVHPRIEKFSEPVGVTQRGGAG
jgi:Ala-tRNA(Pro) deacylase